MKTFSLFKRGDTGKAIPADQLDQHKDRPWHFRFEFRKKSYTRTTETADKTKAQTVARKLYAQITEAVKAQRFDDLDATKVRRKAACTFGDVFPLYRRYARVAKPTAENNIDALVNLVRTALDAGGPSSARPKLTEADINSKPLTILNQRLALDFQHALGATDYTPAATNFNSLLRQAASVFASRRNNNMLAIYAEAGLKIPDSVKAFKSAPLLRETSHEFQAPSAELIQRIRDAAPALKASDPNGYRIYLLALGCGLSKKDIAHLCGSQIKHVPSPAGAGEGGGTPGEGRGAVRHIINLRRSKTGKLVVYPMEEYTWQELVALSPLLAAPRSADPIAPLNDYLLEGDVDERCNKAFRRFGAWLTSLGWNQRKKAHGLRKLCGSLLREQVGSDTASKLLGNTREVFDAHYSAMLHLPNVKILG